MAKAATKAVYVCQACGAQSGKWAGRCNDCGEWNTLEAEVVERKAMGMALAIEGTSRPVAMSQVDTVQEYRFSTGSRELDRVLGGGIVPGSLVLVGGPPGIGKSTLLLQICQYLTREFAQRGGAPILYVSGEESARQIRLRADRLGVSGEGVLLLSETRLEAIEQNIRETRPGLVIVDSIQTLFKSDLAPAPGSVTQVRECAAALMRLAKTDTIPILLVGHVTKDGQLAGPRVLEHLVDTVLHFEGEGLQNVRALRSVKNRFGATDEVGLFEMGAQGLVPIPDASQFFLSQRASGTSGSVVFPSLEGTRPVLVEIQALVSDSLVAEKGAPPVRRAVGLDQNRLGLLLAVMSRRVRGMSLGLCDVYANVAGGLRLSEPGLDLALALAVASARRDIVLDQGLAACGEIGLGGEVRAVSQLESRLKELSKMGFQRCLVPQGALGKIELNDKRLKLLPVASVSEALQLAGIPLGKSERGESRGTQPATNL